MVARGLYLSFLAMAMLLAGSWAGYHIWLTSHQNPEVKYKSGKEPAPLIAGIPNDREMTLLADTAKYNKLLLHLVHGQPTAAWPVKAPYPLPGAILPYHRIVAYYGNFYAQGMGILGQLPEDELIRHLAKEVTNWQRADTVIPVIPAIHYVTVTAQSEPGAGAKYRLRMPPAEIDKALALARKLKGILFLDIQVGHSTLEEELPPLEYYLRQADVHLGIDPEYSMKNGAVPCTQIGSFDAADINYASGYLAGLVRKYNLTPKILVVHRFTKEMVTNYRAILTRPEVQLVINMDGFGFPAKKRDSYKTAITREPVQFAGFKLFYQFDLSKGYKEIMQPNEVLTLYPAPIYIQYQ